MSIAFNQIGNSTRTPGTRVEFDSSRATRGIVGQPSRILVLGQRTSDGGVAALTPTQIQSTPQAIAAFGKRSMLAAMIAALRSVNDQTEVWSVGLADDGAAVACVKNLAFTGPATAAGTLYLYIAGRRIQVAVVSGDTATQIAVKVVAAITAYVDPLSGVQLPVTAAQGGSMHTGEVNITAANAGLLGNWIDVRANYNQGEAYPAGVNMVVTTPTAGTGALDVTTAIAVIGEKAYSTFVSPWTDATNLTAMEAELESRWGPDRQIGGTMFAATVDSLANAETLGESRNSKQCVIIGLPKSPTPPYELAAYVAGVEATEPNPARPRTTMPVPGVLAPAEIDRLVRSERELLLHDGIATLNVDDVGNVTIERLITTYQSNAQNLPSDAYLDITTPRRLVAMSFAIRARFAEKYPRCNLANDGDPIAAGAVIVTPNTVRAEFIGLGGEFQQAGWITDVAAFVKALVVERNANNPNRMDVQVPPELTGLFLDLAVQIQFFF